MPLYKNAVPYVGATTDVDLGNNSLDAASIYATGRFITMPSSQVPTVTIVYGSGALIAAAQDYRVYVLGRRNVSSVIWESPVGYTDISIDNSGRAFYLKIDWVPDLTNQFYEIIVGPQSVPTNGDVLFSTNSVFASAFPYTLNFGDGTVYFPGCTVSPNSAYSASNTFTCSQFNVTADQSISLHTTGGMDETSQTFSQTTVDYLQYSAGTDINFSAGGNFSMAGVTAGMFGAAAGLNCGTINELFENLKAYNNIAAGGNDPTAGIDAPAATTAQASLRIRTGTAPAAPNDGDIWQDGTNIKMHIGGVTKTFTLV